MQGFYTAGMHGAAYTARRLKESRRSGLSWKGKIVKYNVAFCDSR